MPRYIFNSNLEQAVKEAKEYILRAIVNSNIMDMIGYTEGLIFTEEYGPSLVMPIVNEDLKFTDIDFVSRYALTETCNIHKDTFLRIICNSKGMNIGKSFTT